MFRDTKVTYNFWEKVFFTWAVHSTFETIPFYSSNAIISLDTLFLSAPRYQYHFFHKDYYSTVFLFYLQLMYQFLFISVQFFKNWLRSLILFIVCFNTVLFIDGKWLPHVHVCLQGVHSTPTYPYENLFNP